MFDTIKKVAFTREKVEELAKDLIERGKLTEKEGEKFVQEMVTRAEESKVAVKEQTEKIVITTLSKLPLAKQSDIQELRSEIEQLRKDLEEIKGQNASS